MSDFHYSSADEASALVPVHSAAIHIEHKITLLQRQLWFWLLFNAYSSLDTQDEFEISLSELKRFLNFQGKNNAHLKESMRKLIGTVVEWNVFTKDSEEWGATALLAQCNIKTSANSGTIRYAFSPEIRRRLAEPSMYAKINLLISQRFSSKHALALYCLALDYLRVKDNYGTKTFSVDNLRKYLGLEANEYQKIHDFNRYILQKAQNEINENSDITLNIIPKKEGRKVKAYQLEMTIKSSFIELYRLPGSSSSTKTPVASNPSPSPLYSLPESVLAFCIKEEILPESSALQTNIQKAMGIVGIVNIEDYLLQIISQVDKKNKIGLVQNKAGFFIHQIGDEKALRSFLEQKSEQEKKSTLTQQKKEALLNEKFKGLYDTHCRKLFGDYLLKNYSSLKTQIHEFLDAAAETSVFHKNWLQNQFYQDPQKNIHSLHATLSLSKHSLELGFEPISYDLWLSEFKNDAQNKSVIEKIQSQVALELRS
ncbi:MAG: replication initiation protein [Bacteriovoracia bacterium]